MDWIGLGQSAGGLGWIGFSKMDPCPTTVLSLWPRQRQVDLYVLWPESRTVEWRWPLVILLPPTESWRRASGDRRNPGHGAAAPRAWPVSGIRACLHACMEALHGYWGSAKPTWRVETSYRMHMPIRSKYHVGPVLRTSDERLAKKQQERWWNLCREYFELPPADTRQRTSVFGLD